MDPALVLSGAPPQLVDEWQLDATRVWNHVRAEVELGTVLSRRAMKRTPGVFPAKLRSPPEGVDSADRKWPRRNSYAVWVHDVLVVHGGIALVRTHALPVAAMIGPCIALEPGQVRGLGDRPLMTTVTLDDGTAMQIAAPDQSRDAMVGPFLDVAAPSGPDGSSATSGPVTL